MIISIILLFVVPLIVVGLTFLALGEDFFKLFNGGFGDIFGRLFSDLMHVLLLWAVGAIVELWLLYTVIAQIL